MKLLMVKQTRIFYLKENGAEVMTIVTTQVATPTKMLIFEAAV